ncbi:MAG: YihY/virulence factor BrkB family protein [Oscillospiraceae bacterium]|nr:YihY/virulence factor BrkB family protein [Oscillospiraceae bacterium]
MGKPSSHWRLVRFIFRIFDFLKPMNISIRGAYTSFFLILSLFPSLMILFCLLSYTSYGVEEVLALAAMVLPEPFLPLAQRLLNGAYDNASGTVLSLSIITALWSASRGMLGLMEGMNAVYGLEEKRNYFATRGISALYTLLIVVVLVLTLVLHVFGTTILDYLRMTTHPVLLFLMDLIDLRFFLLFFVQTVFFTAMYVVLPNRKNSVIKSLPGALFASVGWLTVSDLFSLYVEYFPRYANIFGSVYAAALAMLWLYFCISILFYGGALNRYLMERRS